MTLTLRLLRRTAALLASIALLAVPARGVLACEMVVVAPETAPIAVTVHDHTAMTHGASMTADVSADVSADAPDDAPDGQPHPQCDHLVGCAPLALAHSAILLPESITTPASNVPFVAAGVESPARALEPPPPKA